MARMMSKPLREPPLFRIEEFKGLNISGSPSRIDNNQTPDMLNMTLDEKGALNKRTGYEKVFETSLGQGKINGMYLYKKTATTEEQLLIAHGTKLYKIVGENPPEVINSSMVDGEVNFFVVGDKCFVQDGGNLRYYTGQFGLVETASNAYKPTLTISRPPSGGGEPFEDFNLIGTGFYESFSGDGTSTVYQLSLTGLDSTPVEVDVDDDVILESEGLFTVDRVNGRVTFTTAPTSGTNNVKILAYKTIPEFKERIYKCRFNVKYGGANDSRVFVSGNPDFPNQVWRSGLYEPTYFPENGFYKVGNDNESVIGFVKQYDYLIIEKERTKYSMSFELNNGEPSFPIKALNDRIGTIARKSIEIIDNDPISLSRDGVYLLKSSQVRDERNVEHISGNVDNRLLSEPNLEQAVSIDYDKKYWLSVNGNVYLYDYELKEWYFYNNIHASCFLEMGGYLYFGSALGGMVYRFKKRDHLTPYNDDGSPIQAYWYSKIIDFGVPEMNKLVSRIYFSLKPDSHTSADLYIRTNKKGERFISKTRMDQLNFWLMDFERFSFISSDVTQATVQKVKEKKIAYLQIKLENNDLDESLGILSIGIKNTYQNEVK